MNDDDPNEEDNFLIASAFLSGNPRQMTETIRDVARGSFCSLTDLKRALKAEGLTIAGFTHEAPTGLNTLEAVAAKVRAARAKMLPEISIPPDQDMLDPKNQPRILAEALARRDDTMINVALLLIVGGIYAAVPPIKQRLKEEGLLHGPGAMNREEFELRVAAVLSPPVGGCVPVRFDKVGQS